MTLKEINVFFSSTQSHCHSLILYQGYFRRAFGNIQPIIRNPVLKFRKAFVNKIVLAAQSTPI